MRRPVRRSPGFGLTGTLPGGMSSASGAQSGVSSVTSSHIGGGHHTASLIAYPGGKATRLSGDSASSDTQEGQSRNKEPGPIPPVAPYDLQDLAQRMQVAVMQMDKACRECLHQVEVAHTQLHSENERLRAENERLQGHGQTGGTGDAPRDEPRGGRGSPLVEGRALVMPPVSMRPPSPCYEDPPTMSIPGAILDAEDHPQPYYSKNPDRMRERERSLTESRAGRSGNIKLKTQRSSSQLSEEIVTAEPGTGSNRKRKGAVFADLDKMKAKVREAVMKQEYDVKTLYHDEGVWQWIAKSQVFDTLTLGVICFNAIWIAVDLDLNKEKFILNAHWVFIVAEYFFFLYFLVEIFIRFMAFKEKRACLGDGWFMFDSILVLTMILDAGILTLVLWVTGMHVTFFSSGWVDPNVMKLFRMVKLTRMARMVRLLRATPELMILIKGIAVAFRTVTFTLALLLMFIFLFAVLFKSLLEDTTLGVETFRTVPRSMMSLLLFGVLPDNAPLVNDIWDINVAYGMISIVFVYLTSLTVMNMLVGVLVEVVGVVSSVEREEMNVHFVYSKLQELLIAGGLDTDGDAKISKTEFEALILNPKAARMVQEVGVDVVGLVDYSEYLFQDDQASLSFPEFMDLVLQLRGSNTATVKDIVDLRKFFSSQVSEIVDQVKGVVAQMAQNDKPHPQPRSPGSPGQWWRNGKMSPVEGDFGTMDFLAWGDPLAWSTPRPPSGGSYEV
mmetsp:Transcript_79502/g.184494  ORF Transcript_79502/g.184494 Transcript_79502/m.184494 type:complete len:728 (+) Transcript_79502:129-2312(+)